MRYVTSSLAVLALVMPNVAAAETPDEVEAYFDEIWDFEVPTVDSCADSRVMDEICGQAAEQLICSTNAMYYVLEDSGLVGEYASDLADLTNVLGDHRDYLAELAQRGYMNNPGEMSESQMISYCGRVGAAISF